MFKGASKFNQQICGWTVEGEDIEGSLCSVESCIECTDSNPKPEYYSNPNPEYYSMYWMIMTSQIVVCQWRIDDEQIIVIYKVNEKGKEEEETKE